MQAQIAQTQVAPLESAFAGLDLSPMALALTPVATLLQALQAAERRGDKKAARLLAAAVRDCWATPKGLFEDLHAQHRFTVDTSAEAWNAKLPHYYGIGGAKPDGLKTTWSGETWFGNWPFSQLDLWLPHAWAQYDPQRPEGRAGVGVAIIPATRTEQDFWQKYVEPFRDNEAVAHQLGVHFNTKFLGDRTAYEPPPGVSESSPRFGSVLLIWRPIA